MQRRLRTFGTAAINAIGREIGMSPAMSPAEADKGASGFAADA
jgi:hypothetical protein